jgi:hypothetical protein
LSKIYQIKFGRDGFDSDPPSSSEISFSGPSGIWEIVKRELLFVQTADVVDATEMKIVLSHAFESSSLEIRRNNILRKFKNTALNEK